MRKAIGSGRIKRPYSENHGSYSNARGHCTNGITEYKALASSDSQDKSSNIRIMTASGGNIKGKSLLLYNESNSRPSSFRMTSKDDYRNKRDYHGQ